MNTSSAKLWVALRLYMGWLFFWAFIDKLFGFGFATKPADAWIAGGSPTLGFLKFAAKGPFADFFHSLAPSGVVAWLFMLGLLFVGTALLLGIAVRLASYAGMIMVALMYLALLWPANNPILDEHILEFIVLWGLASSNSGQWLGLGKWWVSTGFVQRYPWLA